MPDPTYKTVEVTGTSTAGVTDAINNAIAKAAETLRNIDWFEVTTVRGSVSENKAAQFQVTMKIGFRLE